MTEETVFANALIVMPDEVRPGSLCLRDGRIAEIGEGSGVPSGAVDCGGDYLAPGLVELHTDNLERHIQPRPNVDWPHEAAILAHDAELESVGITTVFDAMRVGSIPGGLARFAAYARGLADELGALRDSGELRISHFLHLRAEVCSETLEEEMAAFGPEDRVGIVSLMDHTPGQRQFRDMAKLKAYLKGKHGLDDAGFAAHVAQLRSLREEHGERHEAAAVAHAARYGAVLASHDDTTEEQVAVSERYGVRLAEYPTTAEAAHACHDRGIAVIVGAPNLIRGSSHSGNVAAQELAEAGHLVILSSDYVPSALLYGAVRLGLLWGDMARGMATVTANPARATGLLGLGRIDEGARADLVRFGLRGDVPAVRGAGRRGGAWAEGASRVLTSSRAGRIRIMIPIPCTGDTDDQAVIRNPGPTSRSHRG